MTRLAVLSDVHGNVVALEAVRKAIHADRPDLVAIAGDLALNGPDPAATIDLHWRNPRLHDEARVKHWLACDEHADHPRVPVGRGCRPPARAR